VESRLLRNNDDILVMQAQRDGLMQERFDIHKAGSDRNNLDAWEVERKFYLVDGYPVMEMTDPLQGTVQAVVPDFFSGKYVVDNAFLPLLTDSAHHHITKVSRDDFLTKAISMMAPENQIGGHLALVKN
jgi:hypothetical protein